MSMSVPVKKLNTTEEPILQSQVPLTADEAADLLEEAISSSDPYPVNLDWLVPLLHYKHISSLTTHLKRHFEKETDYKKCSVGGGVRAYTYQITVRCFKKICTKARHASRKQVALYWIKMIDKKAPNAGGGDNNEDEPKRRKYTKKSLGGTPNTTAEGQINTPFDDDEELDVEDDDEDDFDYSPYSRNSKINNINNNNLNNNNNLITNGTTTNIINNNDSDVELDSSSSAFLRSLRNQTHVPAAAPLSTAQLTSPMSALTVYAAPATAPQMRTTRRDFSNVNILSRKRKQQDDTWGAKDQKRAEDSRAKERVSNTRTNLRMLSQLALGLR